MHNSKSQPVTSVDVWKTWFPLALSWLMMGIELPLLSAVVARLANPEVNLGAYGGGNVFECGRFEFLFYAQHAGWGHGISPISLF